MKDFPELAALADGSLPAERRGRLEDQVSASAELAGLLAEQERAVALARSAAAETTAPAGLRTRVEAQRRARSARVRGRLRLGLAGAAAAVAAGAVAVGLNFSGSGTAPERFHAALAATPSARGASGDATLTRTSSGWRIQLDVSGLPRLSRGRYYEAWLRDRAGVLVPVGTFNGGDKVTLWAGVSAVAFRTITVTRERADGDQASSGKKVLIGHLRRSSPPAAGRGRAGS